MYSRDGQFSNLRILLADPRLRKFLSILAASARPIEIVLKTLNLSLFPGVKVPSSSPDIPNYLMHKSSIFPTLSLAQIDQATLLCQMEIAHFALPSVYDWSWGLLLRFALHCIVLHCIVFCSVLFEHLSHQREVSCNLFRKPFTV